MTIAWRAGEREETRLRFRLPGGTEVVASVDRLLLAGYSGRSKADIDTHLAEMARLGVAAPGAVPTFLPAMTCLLTQGDTVEAIGPDTRPEVEYVLFEINGTRFVTVGNDQFDLATERQYSAVKSKNLCQKVVARAAWPLHEVSDHWDELILELRSGGTLLQSNPVAAILAPGKLIDEAEQRCGFRPGLGVLFSGTVPMLAAVEPEMRSFSMTLRDPVLRREIGCDFRVEDVAQGRMDV